MVAASFVGMTVGMLWGMLFGTWATEKLCGALRAAMVLPGWLRRGASVREHRSLGVRDV